MKELVDDQNDTMDLIVRLTEEVEALSELCLALQGRVSVLKGDIDAPSLSH